MSFSLPIPRSLSFHAFVLVVLLLSLNSESFSQKRDKLYLNILSFAPTQNYSKIDSESYSRVTSGYGDFWVSVRLDTPYVLRQLYVEHATQDSLDTSYEIEYYDLTDNPTGDYSKRGKPDALFKVSGRGGSTFHADTATSILGARTFRLNFPASKRIGFVWRNVRLAQAPSSAAFGRNLIMSFVAPEEKKQAAQAKK